MKISFIDTLSPFLLGKRHYTRKYHKEGFMEQDVGKEKMYKLYTDECEKAGREPVKSKLYRRIFTDNYKLSFFKPKKTSAQYVLCMTKRRRTTPKHKR